MEDRRKNKRFRIPFNVDVIPCQNSKSCISGEIRDFSPEGFSFEAKKVDLELNTSIRARFQIYPEYDFINVLGRVVWKIRFGVDCQVGIEISEIDTGTIHDLGFPFNMWKDKIKNK